MSLKDHYREKDNEIYVKKRLRITQEQAITAWNKRTSEKEGLNKVSCFETENKGE